jgi:hypothetical protein
MVSVLTETEKSAVAVLVIPSLSMLFNPNNEPSPEVAGKIGYASDVSDIIKDASARSIKNMNTVRFMAFPF